jgi:MoxR-like ATPase
VFRDDEAAREELLASLQRDAKRAEVLAERVRELEDENRALRAKLAIVAAAQPSVPDGDIHFDTKLVDYIDRIVEATHAEAHEQWILSGALQVDAQRIGERARDLARNAGRRYAIPDDVRSAAAEILPWRILVRMGDVESIVSDLLAGVEVP